MIFRGDSRGKHAGGANASQRGPEMEDKRNIINAPMISVSCRVRDIRSAHHPVKAAGVSDVLINFHPTRW
jgi:hypothetical protein